MSKNSLLSTSRYWGQVQVVDQLTHGGVTQMSSAGEMDSNTSSSASLELSAQLKLPTKNRNIDTED